MKNTKSKFVFNVSRESRISKFYKKLECALKLRNRTSLGMCLTVEGGTAQAWSYRGRMHGEYSP